MNGNPKLDRDSDDIGGLADLPGPKAVRDQLAERIAVLQAEQARRNTAASGASRELIGLLGAFGLGPQAIDRADAEPAERRGVIALEVRELGRAEQQTVANVPVRGRPSPRSAGWGRLRS